MRASNTIKYRRVDWACTKQRGGITTETSITKGQDEMVESSKGREGKDGATEVETAGRSRWREYISTATHQLRRQ